MYRDQIKNNGAIVEQSEINGVAKLLVSFYDAADLNENLFNALSNEVALTARQMHEAAVEDLMGLLEKAVLPVSCENDPRIAGLQRALPIDPEMAAKLDQDIRYRFSDTGIDVGKDRTMPEAIEKRVKSVFQKLQKFEL